MNNKSKNLNIECTHGPSVHAALAGLTALLKKKMYENLQKSESNKNGIMLFRNFTKKQLFSNCLFVSLQILKFLKKWQPCVFWKFFDFTFLDISEVNHFSNTFDLLAKSTKPRHRTRIQERLSQHLRTKCCKNLH